MSKIVVKNTKILMHKFLLTDDAKTDLDNIWFYIAEDNISAADKVEDDIIKAFYNLSENPLIGHSREDLTPRNVRFWSVHSYLIIYDATTEPISIVRVLSGYRDITSVL